MELIDRERFGAGYLPIWVHHEHSERWTFASRYVSGNVVADCACGTGHGTKVFAEAGASLVYAFDLSEDAVASTKLRCADFNNVTTQMASGLNLPLPADSIDTFISFETIEHIIDDHAFLKEIQRVIKTKAAFIASTPNRSITMPGKSIHDSPWNPFHVREYNLKEFHGLLKQYFDDVILFGQNPRSASLASLLQRVGRRLPGNIGGRINSALKLPLVFLDKSEYHSVIDLPEGKECEYLVAVCRKPHKVETFES